MEMIGAASLLRLLPEGYEDACYKTKAIIRNRGIKDPNDLMMLVLFHLLTGCSLIEISEISKLAKLGAISDVAFMKRFSNCTDWFKYVMFLRKIIHLILEGIKSNCYNQFKHTGKTG